MAILSSFVRYEKDRSCLHTDAALARLLEVTEASLSEIRHTQMRKILRDIARPIGFCVQL